MLDPSNMTVRDRARFFPLHERYLNVTSILCLAGLAHVWTMIAGCGPLSLDNKTRSGDN